MDSLLNRLQEVLSTFKSSENSANDNFFQKDDVAKKVITAWLEIPLTIHEPFTFGSVPEHRQNQWKYAWTFRKIDYRDLEKTTGIADRELLQQKVQALISHQMIYPDGSVSRGAQSLISSKHG